MNSDIQNFWEKLHKPYIMITSFILTVLIIAIFQVIMLPEFAELTGGGIIFDMQSSYSPERAYEIVENYGEKGRAYYSYIQLLDILFPLAYAFCFALLIHYFYSHAFPNTRLLQVFTNLPLVTGIVDMLENTGIFLMLHTYPRSFTKIAIYTSTMTLAKGVLFNLSLLLLLIGLVSFLIRKKSGRKEME